MRILRLGLLLALAAPAGASTFDNRAKGTTTAEFLKLGVGARAAGMGDAQAAVADDATALYWNIAGLMEVKHRSAVLMHAQYLGGTYFDYAGYAQKLGEWAAVGAGVQYLSAGAIQETGTAGETIGQFHPNSLSAGMGAAFKLPEFEFMTDLSRFSGGVSFKYIRSQIIKSASAWAFDLGLRTPVYFERARFAFTAVNIGRGLQFGDEFSHLPFAYRLGSSIKILPGWIAAVDTVIPKDNVTYFTIGTEYAWPVTGSITLAGRMGFNSNTKRDIDGFSGASLGFGLDFRGMGMDYAITPMGGLGQAHRLSLTFDF